MLIKNKIFLWKRKTTAFWQKKHGILAKSQHSRHLMKITVSVISVFLWLPTVPACNPHIVGTVVIFCEHCYSNKCVVLIMMTEAEAASSVNFAKSTSTSATFTREFTRGTTARSRSGSRSVGFNSITSWRSCSGNAIANTIRFLEHLLLNAYICIRNTVNNNITNQDSVYGAVVMTQESLLEFTRFTQWMQNSAWCLPTFGPSNGLEPIEITNYWKANYNVSTHLTTIQGGPKKVSLIIFAITLSAASQFS